MILGRWRRIQLERGFGVVRCSYLETGVSTRVMEMEIIHVSQHYESQAASCLWWCCGGRGLWEVLWGP